MSFPWNDAAWCEVGAVLEPAGRAGQRILAPDLFWWRLPTLWRYVPANLTTAATYDWVVVHKGEMEAIPRPFLEHVLASMPVVLANDVFVVFGPATDAPVDSGSSHVAPFMATLSRLPSQPSIEHPAVHDRVLGTSPTLRQFGAMTVADARAAQDEFVRKGGYRYPTRRDQAYYREMLAHRDRFLAETAGGRVLELCCGAQPIGSVPDGTTLVRSDFSRVGVAQAAARDGAQPGLLGHVVCDASALAIADRSCDGVLFVDSIEHVFDAAAVLDEAGRVLRPAGELLLTFANRNSLNQVLTRSLGYPEFVTNHQHVREFTLAEIEAMLADVGLHITATAGVELRPYWGVPGVDPLVRDVIDDDEELVEILRELGERAGAEYAYLGVVRAGKRA